MIPRVAQPTGGLAHPPRDHGSPFQSCECVGEQARFRCVGPQRGLDGGSVRGVQCSVDGEPDHELRLAVRGLDRGLLRCEPVQRRAPARRQHPVGHAGGEHPELRHPAGVAAGERLFQVCLERRIEGDLGERVDRHREHADAPAQRLAVRGAHRHSVRFLAHRDHRSGKLRRTAEVRRDRRRERVRAVGEHLREIGVERIRGPSLGNEAEQHRDRCDIHVGACHQPAPPVDEIAGGRVGGKPFQPLGDTHVLVRRRRPRAAGGVDRDDHAFEVTARLGRHRKSRSQRPAGVPAHGRERGRGHDPHAVAVDLGPQRSLQPRVEPAAAQLDEPAVARERRRPRPPAETLARFEQAHPSAGARQLPCRHQARQPAAHDDDVVAHSGSIAHEPGQARHARPGCNDRTELVRRCLSIPFRRSSFAT